MLERIHFLVVYIGSAAMAAFLAACLSSPRIATYECQSSNAYGAEQCEVVVTQFETATDTSDKTAEPAASEPDGQQFASVSGAN